MPKVFIAGIVLFLLLVAGAGLSQAARTIPWDCHDWQAADHEDRTTAILETLAAGRGQALYCGVDQSAAFTKAEMWAAGKDRNERDDTVYISRIFGVFRGFTAMQEGWLTEGESGITGYPPSRIFEFPPDPRTEEERRRTIRIYERLPIQSKPTAPRPPATGPTGDAIGVSRQFFTASPQYPDFESFAQGQARLAAPVIAWPELARATALEYCQNRGYSRATRVRTDPATEQWIYTADTNPAPDEIAWAAYQTREWTGACENRSGRTIERLLIPANPPAVSDQRIRSALGDTVIGRFDTGLNSAHATARAYYTSPGAAGWLRLAAVPAREHCRSLGYRQARNVAVAGDTEWHYTPNRENHPYYVLEAYQSQSWSATCEGTGNFGVAAGPPAPPVAISGGAFNPNAQYPTVRSWAEQWARWNYLDYTPVFVWAEAIEPALLEHCHSLGYRKRVFNIVTNPDAGDAEEYAYTPNTATLPDYSWAAYKTRHWTATCERIRTRRE